MATEIGRSLEEIDIRVKGLNKTLKASTAETKELDKALKLDPKGAEMVERKMQNLQNTVGTAAQKVALLKQKQDEANKAFQKGDLSAAEYKKIELSVLRAQNQLQGLNNEIAKTQKISIQQVSTQFDKLTSSLNKAQSTAQKLSGITLKLVAALGATITAFVAVGDELDDVSTKFSITAEHLQRQRFLYSRATDDAKNYDKALSKLNSVMSSIARGKGTAYIETLERLGVSTTTASGATKSAAEVYEEIVSSLSRVADETERASLASIIFGETGLSVALVAGLTNDEIAQYIRELEKAGIVSNEAAAQAGAIADKAQATIIPILTKVAGWFANMSPEEQKFVFFLLMLIILLAQDYIDNNGNSRCS